MRSLLSLLSLLILFQFSVSAQDQTGFKVYSYSELFQIIEEEKDSVFRLKDAMIRYNQKTDQRFKAPTWPGTYKDTTFQARNDIIIDKHIELENVLFDKNISVEDRQSYVTGAIYDIHFKKDVILRNTSSLFISFSKFDGRFDYSLSDCSFVQKAPENINLFYIDFSTFEDFDFFKNCNSQSYTFGVYLNGNIIKSDKLSTRFFLSNFDNRTLSLTNNYIEAKNIITVRNQKGSGIYEIKNNEFVGSIIVLGNQNTDGNLDWSNNSFSNRVQLGISPLGVNDEVEWDQFKDNAISMTGFVNYSDAVNKRFPVQQPIATRPRLDSLYYDSVRYYNENIFAKEIGLKGNFYNYYKNKYNTAVANEVYLELKDFETARLKVLYNQDKTFDAFFKWKINQFLKLFAAYGTEPARAITMSVYVVLIFALIYLFFPNYWDSHGKNRIMDRYRFFTKYMNRKEGMHEVYLEDQRSELFASEDFKNYMLEAKKSIPTFFITTAMPLYRWSVASTKGFSWLLSKVDVLKGTWSNTDPTKQKGKSALLITAFLLALLYDIFIKMLNALMLSINTFTTLGFGEIPIKGLPRYLAIIQGFIGWFMLTIFSVSLISQLLN